LVRSDRTFLLDRSRLKSSIYKLYPYCLKSLLKTNIYLTMGVIINSSSPAETLAAAAQVGANLKGGEVIELAADLGSGKTTFTKGLVSGAGSPDLVTSPSFTIINEYASPKFTIYHFDFYRLNDPGIISRELEEVLGDGSSVIIIEWPGIIEDTLPENRLVINLQTGDKNSRVIKIDGPSQLAYLWRGL